MRLLIAVVVALLLSTVAVARADSPISIVVGNHNLLPNTPGQLIPIYATGNSLVDGNDVLIQIGATPPSGDPPNGPSPAISYLGYNVNDPRASTIQGSFTALSNPIFIEEQSTPYNVRIGQEINNFGSPIPVNTNGGGGAGLLITLVVDTTGFSSGSWPLLAGPDNVDGGTGFTLVVLEGHDHLNRPIYQSLHLPVSVTDGSVTIVPTPEPSSIVLGFFAAAGLGIVAMHKGRRRAV